MSIAKKKRKTVVGGMERLEGVKIGRLSHTRGEKERGLSSIFYSLFYTWFFFLTLCLFSLGYIYIYWWGVWVTCFFGSQGVRAPNYKIKKINIPPHVIVLSQFFFSLVLFWAQFFFYTHALSLYFLFVSKIRKKKKNSGLYSPVFPSLPPLSLWSSAPSLLSQFFFFFLWG